MKLKPYPKYKPSGVEWLGDVPANWRVDRLKWTVTACQNGVWGDEPSGEDDVVCVRVADFDRQRNVVADGPYTHRSVAENQRSGRMLQRGDLLLEKSGGGEQQPVGTVVLFDKEFPAVCSNFVARMPVHSNCDSQYLTYLHAAIYAVRINTCSIKQNTGIQNLDSAAYLDEKAPVPDLGTQKSIAAFLDHETTKIDTLIAKQEALIELLQEKRQAVISHAVTKGLDPTAPMKPSGVEWLGDVPERWEVRAINSVSTKITNGYVGPTRDILLPDGVPYIQATHVKGGKVKFDGAYFVSKEWSEGHAKSILKAGDVLIVQTGAGTGDVALCSHAEEGLNCHALIIVSSEPSCLTGSFLSVALQSSYGQSCLESVQTGAMHPHLNCGEVKFVKIPLPPLEEQEKIVRFLTSESDRIDTLIAKARQAIELQKEHRTALISAAVTGKIDVPGVVDEDSNVGKAA